MKETEARGGRRLPSWLSLLGAGSLFGSAHCIISISSNLPEQMEKRPTCSTSCIIKSFASALHVCTVLYPFRYRTVCTHAYKLHPTVSVHTIFCQPNSAANTDKQAHAQARININTRPRRIGGGYELCLISLFHRSL